MSTGINILPLIKVDTDVFLFKSLLALFFSPHYGRSAFLATL